MELAEVIGISRQAVSKGLRHLRAVGVVEQLPGRYGKWALFAQVHQLILGEVALPDNKFDVIKDNVPPSSSSSFYRIGGETFCEGEKKQLLLRDVNKVNVDFTSVTMLDVIKRLKGLGCSRKRAEEGAAAALGGGWDAEKLLAEVLAWELYCESERGSSLTAPGFFVAARISDLQEAPYVEVEADDYDGRRYAEGPYAGFIQH